MRLFKVLLLSAVGVSMAFSFLIAAPAARAETIQIDFTGLDFVLDSATQAIFDVKDANTTRGGMDVSKSDALSTVEFKTDSIVQSDTSNVYVDLYIKDADGIPKGGGTDTTGGNGGTFGFDLFGTDDVEGPWKLELNLTSLDVFYTGNGFIIAAGGKVSSVAGQSLPFGLADIDVTKDVTVAISSANLSGITDDGTNLTAFSASGTGNIKATLVPEPSTLVGLLMGAVALAASVWRRRRR